MIKNFSKKDSLRKILVVDDDFYTRKFFELFLKEAPCKLFTVGNGEEAVKLMNVEVFDLYFIDAYLPQSYKDKIFDKIKRNRKYAPVFFMFGLWEKAPLELHYDDEISFFLQKPFNLQNLRNLLREYL